MVFTTGFLFPAFWLGLVGRLVGWMAGSLVTTPYYTPLITGDFIILISIVIILLLFPFSLVTRLFV